MRLVEVRPGFAFNCCKCGGSFNQWTGQPKTYLWQNITQQFADLDGVSFQAYYCETCAGGLVVGISRRRDL